MRVSSVDPRDQTWEVTHPRYRVYFHDAHGAAEELEITGADVSEILEWAETERRGRTFVLYVCAPLNGLGLVRLQASDANEDRNPPVADERTILPAPCWVPTDGSSGSTPPAQRGQ